jgi:drug/metabolite transporter (DMT)-like permease
MYGLKHLELRLSGEQMSDIARLFQAFVAPAIFFSATALLILSINVRLMGIVAKLRYFVHAKHDAAKSGRLPEAEAYSSQIQSIEQRAEMIRRAFLFCLIGLIGTLISCLLLGLGLYFQAAALASVIVFVAGMLCLLLGAVYYIREVMVALSSVRDEARDLVFMDLGAQPEVRRATEL